MCSIERLKISIYLVLLLTVTGVAVSGQTIHRVACQGDLETLDSLLTVHSLAVQDDLGRSLLHWAVACRRQSVFEYLIDRGLDHNVVDNRGEIPLHIAVRYGNESFFDRLIDLQVDRTWTEQHGASLLEIAVLGKNKIFLKKLVELGVDINAVNERGSSPLEISKRMGAVEIAEWLISLGADQSKVRTFELRGEYLGQEPPDLTPALFAPNFISTEESEFGSVFNATGSEFYYGVDVNGKSEIRYSERIHDQWSTPRKLLPTEKYGHNDPFLSPDEDRLYFISKRTLDGLEEKEDHDIWYVVRNPNGWSQPIHAGTNINSRGNEYYISFTDEGAMYFSSNVNAPEERKSTDLDIYSARLLKGEFQKPISVGDSINTDAYEADVFIDPAEKYLIYCSIRPDGLGRGDLYLSFKNADGTWSKSLNMGATINTEHHELCPFVSRDGKYFFYTSNQDIYWVSAEIITVIKEAHQGNP